jgi:hypothetical protein
MLAIKKVATELDLPAYTNGLTVEFMFAKSSLTISDRKIHTVN